MAQETIQQIKDIELKARQIVKDAKADSSDIILKAKDDAKAFKDDQIAAAKENAQKLVNAVEAGLDGSMAEAEERAGKVIADLKANFEQKKNDAVKIIIDHIA